MRMMSDGMDDDSPDGTPYSGTLLAHTNRMSMPIVQPILCLKSTCSGGVEAGMDKETYFIAGRPAGILRQGTKNARVNTGLQRAAFSPAVVDATQERKPKVDCDVLRDVPRA